MKKLSIVLYVVAALVLLLGGASGPNRALAGRLPKQSTSANTTIAAAGGQGGKGILTIPAAAFQPEQDGYDYENHGRFLKHLHNPGGSTAAGYYKAPARLPHGATVTKMTFYFYDDMAGTDVTAWLLRTNLAGGIQTLAEVVSDFVGGYGSKSDDTIDCAVIDNSWYAYWVEWRIPAVALTDYMGCAVVIEYNYPPAPSPLEYLSIPAAAFQPWDDGYDYLNSGSYLLHYGGSAAGVYLAPVYLPDGALVSKMTFYFFDAVTMVDVQAFLQRTDLAGNYDEMAAIASDWNGGYGSKSDTSIGYGNIDNAQYAYHAVWQLPASASGQFGGCGVIIEYAPSTTARNLFPFSAAAFTPFEDGYDFDNHGRYLYHQYSPGGGSADGWYMAPVYLPQGVVVTKMKFYWYDQTTVANRLGLAKLQRTRLGQDNWEDMASANTWFMSGGYWDSDDTSIAGAAIDNSRYAYWVIWVLPASSQSNTDTRGCGIRIEYSYRLYLPLTLKSF